MNGRQAKKLRRAALGLATALTEAGRDIKKDGYQEIRTVRQPEFDPKGVMSSDPADKLVRAIPDYAVQYKVRPDSFKGIYKALKSGKA